MDNASPPRTAPELDYVRARDFMVDGQLRPSRVTDSRILTAMRRLPRERFVPPDKAWAAYVDGEVPLPGGRCLLSPLVLARLLQLAAPRAGESALVVAAGTGYGATVLAECGVNVTALEEEPALAAMAREASIGAEVPVSFVQGPLAEGWKARAPYDLVVIEGAVREIPSAIGAQVAPDGRLVTVLAPERGGRFAVIAEHSVGTLRARPAFDAQASLLPGLQPKPGFVF